jgi:hypothetical protein
MPPRSSSSSLVPACCFFMALALTKTLLFMISNNHIATMIARHPRLHSQECDVHDDHDILDGDYTVTFAAARNITSRPVGRSRCTEQTTHAQTIIMSTFSRTLINVRIDTENKHPRIEKCDRPTADGSLTPTVPSLARRASVEWTLTKFAIQQVADALVSTAVITLITTPPICAMCSLLCRNNGKLTRNGKRYPRAANCVIRHPTAMTLADSRTMGTRGHLHAIPSSRRGARYNL